MEDYLYKLYIRSKLKTSYIFLQHRFLNFIEFVVISNSDHEALIFSVATSYEEQLVTTEDRMKSDHIMSFIK